MTDTTQNSGNENIPLQAIPYSEKIADDFAFFKSTANAYINLSFNYTTNYRLELKKLYDYYNGHVYESDYKSTLEPFGKKFEGFPKTIKNYPIIKPKIDLLRGEFIKRPDVCTVVVVNDDAKSEKLETLNAKVEDTLAQIIVNKMNASGVQTGIPSEDIKETPQQISETLNESWRDKRAEVGQAALNYIKRYNRLDEKFDVNFLDLMVAGELYSYKGVRHNEPVYEVVNPIDIDYDKDPNLQFIEEGDWVVRRQYCNPSTVIDMFYDELTYDETKRLENPTHSGVTPGIIMANLDGRVNPYRRSSRLIEVIHVCWKSRKKVGILSYIDEMGQPQEMQVPEEYVVDKEAGETVTWYWVNEVLETYRIDGDLFKSSGPVNNQRTSLDNISKCYLPYNGRVLSNRNSRNISPVMLGVPFQVLYNIVHYRLEIALGKMKDSVSLLDINVIPKKWDIEKFLAYVDYTGIGFVDYNKEGVRLNPQHQTSVKLASDTIVSYLELLANIKHEWDDVIGITKQREGQVSASETVGGVERAVVQSSLITEIYFRAFEQFREREYQGLMDYSRLAWINGKKASFVMPEMAKAVYLSIEPDEYSNTEYGVFASNTAKDMEKLSKLEAYAQALIQNGTPGSTITEILDHESFAGMKHALLKAENKNAEFQKFMQEQEAQNAMAAEQAITEREALKHEYALEQIDRKGEWDLRAKQAVALGMDEGANSAEIMALQNDVMISQQELALKDKEINIKNLDSKRKQEADMYKTDKQLEAAKYAAKNKPKPKK